MTEQSMVERVARTIYEGRRESGVWIHPKHNDWSKCHSLTKKRWLQVARAAIDAMREPTDKMARAAATYPDDQGYGGLSETEASIAWHAMIDAALKE